VLGALVILLPKAAFAQAATGSVDAAMGRPLLLVGLLAAASLVPFVFMIATSFVKISTVLQIVKGAIGAQSVPSNSVVMALAAALTLLVMAPVGSRIAERTAPFMAPRAEQSTLEIVSGLASGVGEPLRDFLAANAAPREVQRFVAIARQARGADGASEITARDVTVLVPAFVSSELTEAFSLGFALYLPFLILDLVVANVLLALGMQMMNPTQVSLPFKLLLFVAVDGWGLLAQALVLGYRPM